MSAITGLPALSIQLAGTTLAESDAGALEEVRVQQRLSLPAQCELTFLNPQGRLADAASLPAAESLKVTVVGSSEALFTGEVTAIEHAYTSARSHEVRLRAYDLLHRLRKQQPLKSHIAISLLGLARELAGGIGLTAEGAGGDAVLPIVIQHRQSDLELLIEQTGQCGLYFVLRGDVLHVTSLEGMGAALALKLGTTLHEARIEVNSERACRSVKTSAWDPWKVEARNASASAARVGRTVSAEFPPSRFGVNGERTLTAEIAHDDREAEALAQGELDRRAAGEVCLWGIAEGDARLRPACLVEISGVAGALSGNYVLTSVNHKVDRRSGFTSEISTEPPRLTARSRDASAALGVVTRVDDPAGQGRVRASLPAHGGLETDWMSVVAAGAGKAKGLVMLPDVGDRVLLLFLNGDAARGVVLGGLFSGNEVADSGVESGAVRRYLLSTAGGQKVQIDDVAGRIRLENNAGSCVDLSPEQVLIRAKTKLRIEAIDQPVTIRGKSIDFERG